MYDGTEFQFTVLVSRYSCRFVDVNGTHDSIPCIAPPTVPEVGMPTAVNKPDQLVTTGDVMLTTTYGME